MDAQAWGLLGAIVTAAVAFMGHQMMRPKILAEARKAEAEALSMDHLRFQAEIERLDHKIADQDKKIEMLLARIAEQEEDRQKVAAIADEREQENKSLKVELTAALAKLTKMETRLSAIEALFDVHAIPDEMRAALDRLKKDHG